jgi:hypothetical protein
LSAAEDRAAIGRYARSFDDALGKVVDHLQPEAVWAYSSILASLCDNHAMQLVLADTLMRRLKRLALPEGHPDVIKHVRAIKVLLDPRKPAAASDGAELKARALRGHKTIKRVLAARRELQQ